jgi:hypothetical protein
MNGNSNIYYIGGSKGGVGNLLRNGYCFLRPYDIRICSYIFRRF